MQIPIAHAARSSSPTLLSEGSAPSLGAEIAERYDVDRELGRGATSVVYAATDRLSGERIALKVLLRGAEGEAGALGGGEDQLRFRAEARVLARLDHPSIVRLRGWGESAVGAYLALERLPGEPLGRRLERVGRLTPEEARSLGEAVASALAHAHREGVLHRDVKPDNLFLTGEYGPGAGVKLCDFGLARLRVATPSPDVAGTYAYMAPEQIGVFERPLDGRADLYSLGVVLYQAMAGRLPFEASALRRLVYLHLASRPTSLADLVPDVPPVLAAVVEKLLAKDPDDRYQSAHGLERDLARLDALGREYAARGAAALDRAATAGHTLRRTPPLCGRERERSRLALALEAVASGGTGRVLLLSGPPLAGKRRLLDDLREAALVRQATVLSGRAAGSGPQPFAPVLGAIRAHLVVLAREAPDRLARLSRVLRGLLSGWADPLLQALPELAAADDDELLAPAPDPAPTLEPRLAERRMVEALVRVLVELGRAQPPLVLLIDELHAGDEETTILFERLARRGDDHGILAAATVDRGAPGHAERILEYASDDERGGAGSGERNLRLEVLRVGPLDRVAARELARSVLSPVGRADQAVIDRVVRRGRSMPGPILDAARLLLERGAIAVRGEAPLRELVLDPDHDDDEPGSVNAWEPAALAQLGREGGAALAVLSRVALLRAGFGLETASAAAGRAADEVLSVVEAGARLDVLRREADSPGLVFVSEKLRRGLEQRLRATERAEVSARIAEHLIGLPRGHTERSELEIGHHLAAAGRPVEALPWVVQAGERARAAHAYGSARAAYEQACAWLAAGCAVDHGLALRARTGLADALFALGRYAEAKEAYGQALVLAPPGQIERARLEARLGAACQRSGDSAQATRHLAAALESLGPRGLPRVRAGTLLGLARALLARAVRRGFGWIGGAPAPLDADSRERLRLYRELEYALFFVDTERMALAHLTALATAERHAPSPELGLEQAMHAVASGILGRFGRAERFAARALATGRGLRDERVLAEAHLALTTVRYWAGDHDGAAASAQAAEALFERRYDPFSLNLVRTYRGLSYLQRGALASALPVFEAILETGLEASDERGVGVGHLGRALVLGERASTAEGLRFARRAIDALERIRDGLFLGLALSVEADLLLRAARFGLLGSTASADAAAGAPAPLLERALTSAERAVSLLEQHRATGDHVVLAHAVLAEALAATLSAAPRDSSLWRRRAARARRLAEGSVRLAQTYPNGQSRALRAMARVEAARGQSEAARGALEESVAAAARWRQPLAEAWARVDLACLDIGMEPARARLALDAARNAFAEAGAEAGISAIRRLAAACGELGDTPSSFSSGPGVHDLRAQLRKLESLIEVSETLIAERDLDALLGHIVATAMEVTGAERGVVLLREPVGDGPLVARVARRAGANGAEPAQLEVPLSQSLLVSVVGGGRALCIPDASADPQLAGQPAALAEGLRSVLCVPLTAEGARLGALYLDSRLVRGLFGERDVRLLNTFAAQAALAIASVRSLEALQQANESLRETRAELIQSAKMSAVGELAAGISHEVKNPLNIIGGYSYLLRELLRGHANEKIHGYLRDIDSEVARAAKLIDNLLTFARPADEPLTEVRLDEVCARSVGLVGELALKRGVRIDLQPDDDLPAVSASPGQLQQVLVNVLLNAVQAIDDDSGTVLVRAKVVGAEAIIEVVDSGRGMPPEQAARVFEPFFTTREGGTGLGLYVCYGIVERHGGRIEVDSEPSRGSTFRIRLPLAPATATPTAIAIAKPSTALG